MSGSSRCCWPCCCSSPTCPSPGSVSSTSSIVEQPMDGLIEVARDGAIATVILNRPAKRNALTKAMWRDLGAAVNELSAEDSIRCVIVRGAGEKAFSPGNDIAELATERANKAQAIVYGAAMHETARSLAAC